MKKTAFASACMDVCILRKGDVGRWRQPPVRCGGVGGSGDMAVYVERVGRGQWATWLGPATSDGNAGVPRRTPAPAGLRSGWCMPVRCRPRRGYAQSPIICLWLVQGEWVSLGEHGEFLAVCLQWGGGEGMCVNILFVRLLV